MVVTEPVTRQQELDFMWLNERLTQSAFEQRELSVKDGQLIDLVAALVTACVTQMRSSLVAYPGLLWTLREFLRHLS